MNDSYKRLRRAIGWLGLALPFVLLLGGLLIFDQEPLPSISDYYYSKMRDVFVGAHFAFGVFMWSYREVLRADRNFDADRWPGHLASIFVIGLAIFPTKAPGEAFGVVAGIHYGCALGWMLMLAYFVNCLFPRSTPGGTRTEQKDTRNRIYRWCGRIMLAMIALLVVYAFLPDSAKAPVARFNPVFWLETVAVLAFGYAWLIKGERYFADKES